MNTSQFRRHGVCALCLVAALFMAANFVRGQVTIQPGELRENIAANGSIIRQTHLGFVFFDRDDDLTQNMKLSSLGDTEPNNSDYTYSEGMLYLDFCVPRAGLTTCDLVSDPNAPDVTASITFGWGVIGYVRARGVGAKAAFHSYAEVFELESKRKINYQLLQDMSASLGKLKVVAKIPILLPDITDEEVTQPIAWTTVLKRGRRYRFRIYGLASATTGFNLTRLNVADSDFFGSLPPIVNRRGKVQLRNLTISVSPDGNSGLQETLTSLQQQIGNLADNLEALSNRVDEDVDALRQEQAELSERIDALEANLNELKESFNNHTHDCVVQQVTPRKGEDKYIVKCGPPVKRQ